MTTTVTRQSPKTMLQALACWTLDSGGTCDCGECDECDRWNTARPVLSRMDRALDKAATDRRAMAVFLDGLADITGFSTLELSDIALAVHVLRTRGLDAGNPGREMAAAAAGGGN
jgi:hypothetical protein